MELEVEDLDLLLFWIIVQPNILASSLFLSVGSGCSTLSLSDVQYCVQTPRIGLSEGSPGQID